MKSYFVGMCIQEEKQSSPQIKTELHEAEEDYSDYDDEVNETTNKDNQREEQIQISMSIPKIIEHDDDVNI